MDGVLLETPIANGSRASLTQFVGYLRIGHNSFPSALQFGDEVGYLGIRIWFLLLLEQGFDRARERRDFAWAGCASLLKVCNHKVNCSGVPIAIDGSRLGRRYLCRRIGANDCCRLRSDIPWALKVSALIQDDLHLFLYRLSSQQMIERLAACYAVAIIVRAAI